MIEPLELLEALREAENKEDLFSISISGEPIEIEIKRLGDLSKVRVERKGGIHFGKDLFLNPLIIDEIVIGDKVLS